jgi:CO/xanthine dehydrogenase FAD-binding subunit
LRSTVSTLELLEPRSVREALRMLKRAPATPLAGATDLYVHLNAGTLEPRRFLNLWGLDELRRIELRRGLLSIGALATFTDLQRSALVRRRLPMLAAAAREVGGVQIQNRGTLGGNVANASPAGDALPVLAAAEAVVVLKSDAGGERRVPFNAFYTGYRESVLRPDELIVAFEIAPLAGRQWFRKVGTRFAQAISKVVLAAVRDARPRLALGAVGPTVMRAPRTEEALAAGASIEEARNVLEAEIEPIDDLRSSAAYRRRVAGNLLARFWKDTSGGRGLTEKARGGASRWRAGRRGRRAARPTRRAAAR